MAQRVRKAVLPVAGLGTRFLPATKAMPKEMLTVVDRPLIQYAIEECLAAGIEEFVFVTGRNKSALEDHFDAAYELEDTRFAWAQSIIVQCNWKVVVDAFNEAYHAPMTHPSTFRYGAPGSYTDAGPPERMSAAGSLFLISAAVTPPGTISEYTWASRTRRAISCAYCAP